MRTKIGRLEEAFAGLRLGTFDDHHRFLLARMLARVDAVDADIAAVDTQIGQHLTPFGDAVARLDEIPGIGPTAAAIIIAEIGLDMTRFPTPAHLASWAKFAPGINSSAGKTKGNGSTGHGNRYLARVLGEAVAGAGRTDTFLGARYRRLVRRRGKNKAIVAVGRSLLVIIWHLLADPGGPVPRPRRRPLRPPRQHPRQTTQPHPTARSARLPRHPRSRRLTATPESPPTCPARVHFRISHPGPSACKAAEQPSLQPQSRPARSSCTFSDSQTSGVGTPVHLDLRVKVVKEWQRDPEQLNRLGF